MKDDAGRGIDRAIDIAGGVVALAYKCGFSVGAIWKWKAMGGVPLTAYARKVSEVTGVTMADLTPNETQQTGPENGRRGKGKAHKTQYGDVPVRISPSAVEGEVAEAA